MAILGGKTNMKFSVSGAELFKFGYEIFKKIKGCREVVFLCVGSDRFVSDSLAPIVAEMLRSTYNIPAIVYGGIRYNVNATNLMEVVHYVEVRHEEALVILIDATLDTEVGKVVLTNSAFAGAGNCLPNRKIGDISILGVVGRKVANFNLNSTRLNLVLDMAEFIAKGCYLAVRKNLEFCKRELDKKHSFFQ